MTITPAVRIVDRRLVVNDRTILEDVPDNVTETTASTSGPIDGVFLGAGFDESNSRHVLPLGTLRNRRFFACFRFKLWWMAQKMGDRGRDVPLETQFLLVEARDDSDADSPRAMYTVFLPLIEGAFRACLQGNAGGDELELCLESGDPEAKAASFSQALFVGAGTDPYAAVSGAVRAVKSQLNTFRQRHEKRLPGIVDLFGWCTWDAFYQEVTQEGVEAGLQSLAGGGAPPRFVIIDDGWQSVAATASHHEYCREGESQALPRLTGVKENPKFRSKEDPTVGIKGIVDVAKREYGLKFVYVWHAITGYWGGVHPGAMEGYGTSMRHPTVSSGVAENEPGWKTDPLAVQGVGLVDPGKVYGFYSDLHEYLASAGVDGVKVDVQSILETLGAGLGGRVKLTRAYHQALDASVAKHFPDNGCIACMSHNTDSIYCSKQTAVVRASDDFYPRDPVSHTIHVAAVAYNSVFLGEFMLPDWDMFHSLHSAAEYHASARAISGGPVYVSDAPGKHDFQLLRKLVLPDGSVLRARLPGRPTPDCLFSDPARDGVSLLKIWNMNKYTGVLGVYNCQGAAWSSTERKNTFHSTRTNDAITGTIRVRDVHLMADAAAGDPNWNGECAVYCHRRGEVVVLSRDAMLPVSLKVLEHDIYTMTPVRVLAPGLSFAPLGLMDMFNSGGAIDGLDYNAAMGEGNSFVVRMEVKGCGRFGAYLTARPRRCSVGSATLNFEYDSSVGLLTMQLDRMPDEDQKVHIVTVEL